MPDCDRACGRSYNGLARSLRPPLPFFEVEMIREPLIRRVLSAVVVAGLATVVYGQADEVSQKPPPQEAAPAAAVPGPQVAEAAEGATSQPTEVSEQPVADSPRIAFDVGYGGQSWGKIVFELYPARAPGTVNNFLRYVDDGFYDRTIFHRVIDGYLAQGGAYKSLASPKTDGLHPPVRNEAKNGLKHERGTLAAARAADPHSATAQFFINLADNPKLDHPGHDGWGYCVFGRVVEGMGVIDRVADVRTRVPPDLQRLYMKARRQSPNVERPESSQPLRPPMITRAYRLGADGAAATSRPATSIRPPVQRPTPRPRGEIPPPPEQQEPPAAPQSEPELEPEPVPEPEEPDEGDPNDAPDDEDAPPEDMGESLEPDDGEPNEPPDLPPN